MCCRKREMSEFFEVFQKFADIFRNLFLLFVKIDNSRTGKVAQLNEQN